MTTDWLDDIKFDEKGLIPVIAQDHQSGQVLMVAWMNKEALMLTAEKKQAVYWSRSRQKLWHKGESSGHFQDVHAIFMDCDADVICLSITQQGGIACHTGRESCFYKQLINGQWQAVTPVLKDPTAIYGVEADKEHSIKNTKLFEQKLSKQVDTLSSLTAILEQRKQASSDSSYVASLYKKGVNKILEKVGEEAIEAVIAAKDLQLAYADNTQNIKADKKRTPTHELIYEVADLWFHTMIMLVQFDIQPQAVLDELASRFGVSGHTEKESRSST